MLADIFEKFWNMCLEVYELDPAHFLSVPELVWQAALKKTKVNLDLLTDINMSLLVEKGVRGGICHIWKLITNTLKNAWKILGVNNSYGWVMPQKLPVN